MTEPVVTTRRGRYPSRSRLEGPTSARRRVRGHGRVPEQAYPGARRRHRGHDPDPAGGCGHVGAHGLLPDDQSTENAVWRRPPTPVNPASAHGLPGPFSRARAWAGVVLLILVTATAAVSDPDGPAASTRATAAIAGGRTVFQRMEADARVTVTVTNAEDRPLHALQVEAHLDGERLPLDIAIPAVPAGSNLPIEIDVDTRVRPGTYALLVRFTGRAGTEVVAFEAAGTLTITPRPLLHEMPVVLWGYADVETMRRIGFTHALLWMADHTGVWQAGKPVVPVRSDERLAETQAQLDERLAAGQRLVANVRPGRWVVAEGDDVEVRRERFGRVRRDGQRYSRANVCGLFPEVQQFAWNVGASVGQTFGSHPAFAAAMIHTEVRDGSNPCFHPHDHDAYRAFSGGEIPAQITSRSGMPAGRHGEYVPGDGIVADDHPILEYYRWFWREGDGWNELHSQTHRGLKTGTADGFWTFFDPAVRCPPIWGSGGEVDVLSQWTYSYPEPPRISLATDELFAMAAGRPGQHVMKMTQIIWYRDQTAPNLPEREQDRTDWEQREPEARFITIAPDHLREAFWLKLARPVQGIMYHGIGSLVGGTSHAYRYTHPDTREVLAELVHEVVQPLGPMLMQVPEAPSDVALLQSFTSMVFGAETTWGWGRGWMAEVHQLLQWARLQPSVIYECTIRRDGLDGVSVLVIPNGLALPRSIAQRIVAFQRQGGLVVGDRYLATGIVPDVVLEEPERAQAPDRNKAALQAQAAALRTELAPVHQWTADSSDPDVIVYRRAFGRTDYLFAINDRRTFGDYVGQQGRVMEQGLPHQAVLSVRRPDATVYDLLKGEPVQTRATPAGVEWDASFGPGDGRVYMVTPYPVDRVTARVTRRRRSNPLVELRIAVVGTDGQPLDAVVPVQVEILDPAGAPAEFSGYYGARNGRITIHLDLAANDLPGPWTVRARELASGRTTQARFHYRTR